MCLIAWNWQPQTSTPLLVLSNRDEYYDRATLPLHWWDGAGHEPQLLAGQDRQAGGTWLGLSRTGRLAALTNYRTTDPVQVDSPSRGELVTQFLNSNLTAAGLEVGAIADVTPAPHNGCRPRKPRRV